MLNGRCPIAFSIQRRTVTADAQLVTLMNDSALYARFIPPQRATNRLFDLDVLPFSRFCQVRVFACHFLHANAYPEKGAADQGLDLQNQEAKLKNERHKGSSETLGVHTPSSPRKVIENNYCCHFLRASKLLRPHYSFRIMS